jgi:hypothetical protein
MESIKRYLQDYRFHSREAALEACQDAALCHPDDIIVLQDADGLELDRLGPLNAPKGKQ